MNRAAGAAALGGAVVMLAVAGGFFLTRDAPASASPASSASSASSASAVQDDLFLAARTKGSPDAPIVIFEVADFQCPACRLFFDETLPLLEQEYIRTGKVRLTFINLPLVSIHPNAPAAHELAMCAARQNRFWPVHDLLYRHQAAWARADDPRRLLLGYADSAGLAAEPLKACLESGAAMALLEREANQIFQQGIRSTPSFVVERILIPGAAPIEAWRPMLDSIFEEKTKR